MSIHVHNYGSQNCDQSSNCAPLTTNSTNSPPPLSAAAKLDRLKSHKAEFDRRLTSICRQLAQMVNDIESLRTFSDQLYLASVSQVKWQIKQEQQKQQDQLSQQQSDISSPAHALPQSCTPPSSTASPRRDSTQSADSTISSSSYSSSSHSDSVSKMSASDSLVASVTTTATDEFDQLSLAQIDQLPAHQLNYFINMLYEAAVAGVNSGKDLFLDRFDQLYLEECGAIRENGYHEEVSVEESTQSSENESSVMQSVHEVAGEVVVSTPTTANSDAKFELAPEPDDVSSDGDSGDHEDASDQEASSPSVYEDSLSFSFAPANDKDDDSTSDSSSLVEDIDVVIPESPKEVESNLPMERADTNTKEPSSPTNSSSAVSSASISPSSEHAKEEISHSTISSSTNGSIPNASPPFTIVTLKKRSSSFNMHSSSSTLSVSPPTNSTSSPTQEAEEDKSDRRKTVEIKGYDETGKETFERVVLRPVRRAETFTSPRNRPKVTINSPSSAGETTSSSETGTLSFADRRNMWERRSLGRGYKFRA